MNHTKQNMVTKSWYLWIMTLDCPVLVKVFSRNGQPREGYHERQRVSAFTSRSHLCFNFDHLCSFTTSYNHCLILRPRIIIGNYITRNVVLTWTQLANGCARTPIASWPTPSCRCFVHDSAVSGRLWWRSENPAGKDATAGEKACTVDFLSPKSMCFVSKFPGSSWK